MITFAGKYSYVVVIGVALCISAFACRQKLPKPPTATTENDGGTSADSDPGDTPTPIEKTQNTPTNTATAEASGTPSATSTSTTTTTATDTASPTSTIVPPPLPKTSCSALSFLIDGGCWSTNSAGQTCSTICGTRGGVDVPMTNFIVNTPEVCTDVAQKFNNNTSISFYGSKAPGLACGYAYDSSAARYYAVIIHAYPVTEITFTSFSLCACLQ